MSEPQGSGSKGDNRHNSFLVLAGLLLVCALSAFMWATWSRNTRASDLEATRRKIDVLVAWGSAALETEGYRILQSAEEEQRSGIQRIRTVQWISGSVALALLLIAGAVLAAHRTPSPAPPPFQGINRQEDNGMLSLASLGTGSQPNSQPLYGVKGWLTFIVVGLLYIRPILFGLGAILEWIGYASRFTATVPANPDLHTQGDMLDEAFRIFIGLVGTVVSGYLVVRGIHVARGLREIQPRAVQNAKAFLKLNLAWTFLGSPVLLVERINAGETGLNLRAGMLWTMFWVTVVTATWYWYFNVSKRVQATYPDWKA